MLRNAVFTAINRDEADIIRGRRHRCQAGNTLIGAMPGGSRAITMNIRTPRSLSDLQDAAEGAGFLEDVQADEDVDGGDDPMPPALQGLGDAVMGH